MKTNFLFLVCLALSGFFCNLQAQWITSGDNIYYNKGKVGIGTSSPEYKLDVCNTMRITSANSIDGNFTAIKIGKTNDPGNLNVPLWGIPGYYDIDFYTWRDIASDQIGARIRAERVNRYADNNALVQGMGLLFYTSFGDTNNPQERMRITFSGNVGIGTSSPDHKLDVVGTVRAHEILVNTSKGADFVFDGYYQLRSLSEVEQFITQNKHLPDIAPADSMVQNGVNMGDMQIKLLQKIEELTLYMIELKKENEKQQAQLEVQQNEIDLLKKENH